MGVAIEGSQNQKFLQLGHNEAGVSQVVPPYAVLCAKYDTFWVANQAGVTSQAGLSATTPVLTLYNPLDSGVYGLLIHAAAHMEVANAAAASVWLAAGTNTVAAAVTGTLTTAHRNGRLGGTNAQGNRIVPMLAATLPAAPVAIDLLGVGLTGAITTVPALSPMSKFYDGSVIIAPGTNISIQTSTASGASGLLCSYMWAEIEEAEFKRMAAA